MYFHLANRVGCADYRDAEPEALKAGDVVGEAGFDVGLEVGGSGSRLDQVGDEAFSRLVFAEADFRLVVGWAIWGPWLRYSCWK